MDCSPPGSSVHGVSQSKILEWVAISFSMESSQPRDQTSISCIGRQVLYHWATWEVPNLQYMYLNKCGLNSKWASLVAQQVKNLPTNAGDLRDVGSVPGLGRSLGEGNGNPLQYSWLGNPMYREAWQATVHGVAKSQTQLTIQPTTVYIRFTTGARQML